MPAYALNLNKLVGGKRPVLRRTRQSLVPLNATTGMTFTGASCAVDSTTFTDGQSGSLKLVSLLGATSSIVIDLQAVFGSTVNMSTMDYVTFFAMMAQYTGSAIHFYISDNNGWTNYHHKYVGIPSSQINTWTPVHIALTDLSAAGTGANFSAIRYLKLEATGVTSQVQTTWWQSFSWTSPNTMTPTAIDGFGQSVLSQASSPAPYLVTGGSATPTVLAGLPCLMVTSQVNTAVTVDYDLWALGACGANGYSDFMSPCFALRIWMSPMYDASPNMQAQFYLSSFVDFSAFFAAASAKLVQNPGWNEVRFCEADCSANPQLINHRYLRIKVPAIAGVQTVFAIGDFLMDVQSQPVVTLSFDDGDASFWTYVYPLLQQFNLRATAFVVGTLMDTPGYMTTAQLQTMYSSGCVDVGNHSHDHANLSGDYNAADWIAEYSPQIDKLRAAGFTRYNCHKVVAYPNGAFTSTGWQVLGQLGVVAGRTVSPGPACLWSLMQTPLALADDYECTSSDTLATFQAALTAATKIGAVANCTFHTVVASGATSNQMNLSVLTQIFQWLSTQQAANVLAVKTIPQLIAGY